MDKKKLNDLVTESIRGIYDPEIPVNIFDMGLIYEVKIDDDNNVYVLMTVTAPNCPIADTLPADVKKTISEIEGVNEVDVELTFDPPWTPDNMSDAAKLELGIF